MTDRTSPALDASIGGAWIDARYDNDQTIFDEDGTVLTTRRYLETPRASAVDYARTSRMPFPLLPCDAEHHQRLRALDGEALPGIVLLTRTGTRFRTG